ncbi:MAG: ABC-type transport auxiliary lipoprotein family protein [Desulfobacteraceae bacterium]
MIFFCSCLGFNKPSPPVNYYIFDYKVPEFPPLEPLEAAVRLERFSVASPYDTDRIVYREGPYKINEYNYHRWAAGPGDMVSSFLSRDFRESGLFQAVLRPQSWSEGTYVLEGGVDEIYVKEAGSGREAVLRVSVSVMAEKEPDLSKRVLFQKSYSAAEACRGKDPTALSEALSLAMKRISIELILDLYHAAEKRRTE